MSWFVVIFSLAAFGAAIVFGVELNRNHPYRDPDWAHEGCSLAKNKDEGSRIIILIHNEDAFDTEIECASVILAALNGEEEYFQERRDPDIGRVVEIHFPGERNIPRGVLQYMEITAPSRSYNTLRWMNGSNELYENQGMSVEVLEEIASGETELGFMQDE